MQIQILPKAGHKATAVENLACFMTMRLGPAVKKATSLPQYSVISTAEGTTRRTSIRDFLTKDSRLPMSVDSPPATADSSITAASRRKRHPDIQKLSLASSQELKTTDRTPAMHQKLLSLKDLK
ncbi:Girdin [Manis javanica]|nr:Girdin [Manis javanica]